MSRIAVALGALVVALRPCPVGAVFHISRVNEVMSGAAGNANLQFVEVRMLAGFQNVATNARLTAFNCDGTSVTVLLVLPSNVAMQGTDVKFLLASPDDATFLAAAGIHPDFTFAPGISPSCGMVCYGAPGIVPPAPSSWDAADPNNYVDCVAYGGYTGPRKTSTHDGTPMSGTPTALPAGDGTHSLTRTTDTQSNSADFVLNCPTPTNNSGSVGTFGTCTPPTTTTTVVTTSTTSTTTSNSTTSTSTSTTAHPTTTTSTTITSTSTTTMRGTTTSTSTSTTARPTTTTSTTTTSTTSTAGSSSSTTTTRPSTTSTTTHPTTTTTLPLGCESVATFASIDCRLDALIGTVSVSTDVGSLKSLLLHQLNRAKDQKERAERLLAEGHHRAAKGSLKHALRSLISFAYRVGSLTGRRQIGETTRAMLVELVEPVQADLRTLLKSSSVSGAFVPGDQLARPEAGDVAG